MKDDVLSRVLLFTSHFNSSSRNNTNRLNDQIIGIMEVCNAEIAHQFPNEDLQKNQTEPTPTIPGIKSIIIEIVPVEYLGTNPYNRIDSRYQEVKQYVDQHKIQFVFIEGKGDTIQKLLAKLPEKGIMHIKVVKGHLAIFQKRKGKTTKVYFSEKPLSP